MEIILVIVVTGILAFLIGKAIGTRKAPKPLLYGVNIYSEPNVLGVGDFFVVHGAGRAEDREGADVVLSINPNDEARANGGFNVDVSVTLRESNMVLGSVLCATAWNPGDIASGGMATTMKAHLHRMNPLRFAA